MKWMIQKYWRMALTGVALLAVATNGNAQKQYYWGQTDMPYIEYRGFSLGTNFGMTDMWGDVGTKNPIDHYVNKDYWDNLHFMGGAFLRYTHWPGFSMRLGANFGKLYASDKWNKRRALKTDFFNDDVFQRYLRNQTIRTTVWEANYLLEIAPLRLLGNWEYSRVASYGFQPYILLGGGFFRYNPTGLYKDFVNETERWYDLRDLSTEGQGYNLPDMPDYYSLYSYSAIAGLGVKWDVGRAFGLGLEFQMRHTFTDYLDDVSGKYIAQIYHDIANVDKPGQGRFITDLMDPSYEIIPGYEHQPGEFRGDPSNKDLFSTINLMFYWKINKKEIKWERNYR